MKGSNGEPGAMDPPGQTGAAGLPGAKGLSGIPGQPAQSGAVNTRWGRTSCDSNSTVIYLGAYSAPLFS